MARNNLPLGMQFRTCENFEESTDFSLVLSSKFSQIQKPHRKSFDSDSLHESATNPPQNCNNPSLRGRIADSHEAIHESKLDCHDSTTDITQNFRHTERSEVSKSSESNQAQNAMTQERMGESHRFAQSNKILNNSKIAKMDSSLTAFAQNDESMVDCHESANTESRNNESKSQKDSAQNPKFRSIIVGASGLSLGISIVVAILLGIGAGVLMQKIFETFWVLFLGVFWGIAAAVLNVYKVYKAELRDFETLANDPKYKNMNPK